jgi:magnesium transporter
LEVRDAADLIEQLDSDRISSVFEELDHKTVQEINLRLDYPENSAIRWMTPAISVRPEWTLGKVQEHLRCEHKTMPAYNTSVMVTDQQNSFLGKLALTSLILHPADHTVAAYMDSEAIQLSEDDTETALIEVFSDRRLVNVPVIDANGHLLGRVTVDDAMHVLSRQADDQFMKRDGLDGQTDLFSPRISSYKKRTVWLAVNLATVFLAAWVISIFQSTVQQIVALAVLMPIVSSMGGIAGSQTLTLIIQGLSKDHINSSNTTWILRKELAVGFLHGLTWAVVVGVITIFWFESVVLGAIIAMALIVNLICAAASGVGVPLLLKRVGQDPTLAGSVLLTTVTDVIGFFAFLGLASWWMM